MNSFSANIFLSINGYSFKELLLVLCAYNCLIIFKHFYEMINFKLFPVSLRLIISEKDIAHTYQLYFILKTEVKKKAEELNNETQLRNVIFTFLPRLVGVRPITMCYAHNSHDFRS